MNKPPSPHLLRPEYAEPHWQWNRAIPSPGHMNVDFEGRVDFHRLRRYRLERAREALEKGELDPLQVCKTLSYCTYLMRQKDHPLGQWPTGCPPFDKQVYGPLIKEVRLSRRVRSANDSDGVLTSNTNGGK